jgi:hypothetical protein
MPASIYDIANLEQMQHGLDPLVAPQAARAQLNRELLIHQIAANQQRQLDAQRMAALRSNALAEIGARNAFSAAEGEKERAFRHKEGELRDIADLDRASKVGESADNRAWNMAMGQGRRQKEAEREATEKFYRQQGVAPKKANESDDDFETRAQSELRERARKELGALQGHVQDLQRRRIDVATRAETQRQNEIEQAVRAQLGITPQNAVVELAKPQVRAAYAELKDQMLQRHPLPASAQAELGVLNNELQRTTGLYDEAVKGFRSVGGGFSELFPGSSGGSTQSPAQQGRSPLPPRPDTQSSVGIGNVRAAEGGRYTAPAAVTPPVSDIGARPGAALNPKDAALLFGKDVPPISTLGEFRGWQNSLGDPNASGYADTVFKRTFANQFGVTPEQIGSSSSAFSKERTVSRLIQQHPEVMKQLAEYENSNDPEAMKILQNFYMNLGRNLNSSRWSPWSGAVLPE